MAILSVTGKMGNMRKVQSWVVYPRKADKPDEVIIQCDNRIARVDLNSGIAFLSDGKGGHQGFMKLMPMMGAKEVQCSEDMLEQLRELPVQSGAIRVL